MSFCKNSRPDQTPGAICGNPLNGLKDKVCIQVNKVFDACLKQISFDNLQITLEDICPQDACPPFTFISATCEGKNELKDVTITPLNDDSGCSRIRGTIEIKLDIDLLDKNKCPATAKSCIHFPIDIVLFIPQEAVVATNLDTIVSCIIPAGHVTSCDTAQITACITVIVKVVACVDLLIPTYGYCFIPNCQDFTEESCAGVFDLPLFPKDRQ